MSGHTARGLWRGHQLSWHINCLEMLPVFQALKHFLPDLRDRHVLVRTNNTAVVSYINHQGGLRSRPLYKLAHQILVWSRGKLLSLRAVYLPGYLNVGADILSRQGPRPGEWMLHPEVVKQIWRVFGPAQVDLFAIRENTQCPLWYSLVHPAPLGLDAMVQTWPRLRLYAFPLIALLPRVLERVRRDGVSCQEGSPLTGGGHCVPPSPGAVETLGVAPEVVETILQSRAPSTRKLYALKWKLFTSWCRRHQQDPVNCPVGTVLEFLQDRLSAGLSHSTLKVYMAAIAAYHAPLEALCRPPFEPIEEISNRHLTIKTVLLIVITSLKKVGDLQALSVAPSFLDFAPGLAKAFLHPRPGYIPKVPSSAPRPVVLQVFCPPPFREPDQQKLNWVKAHSTRSVSASKAFLEGVSIQDICNAAGWSTPLTFVRFYDLDLRVAPGSSVLRPSSS
ncbi:ORF V: Enzymatic polyprotein [Labeo rohita]|uniref:ORF V: Enzymatic polyprotein n=1 Tax=Labeo rohita TaxID=84645 RepID=A0ABQ8L3X4_LABRO|nr:ORF V: Enzymatic polyprotein [Labeo rohita]